MSRSRIAVLATGGGSNLQALLDHLRTLGSHRTADVVLVASNRADAGALARAHAANCATATIAGPRAPDGAQLSGLLDAHEIDLVVLAGYLQLIAPEITRRFAGRMLNVHPAPLPAFGGAGMYGGRVHRAVLASGVQMSGPTVHFVDDVYDHGAMIAHWPVPVMPGDDEHALAARVLHAEHLLFPRVVQAVAAGSITATGAPIGVLPPFEPSLDDVSLAERLDAHIADRLRAARLTHSSESLPANAAAPVFPS